jgi:hypothetical protein
MVAQDFQFGRKRHFPSWFSDSVGGMVIAIGVFGLLGGGNVIIPTLLIVFGVLGIYEYRWRLRTPLLRIASGTVTIYRRPYIKPKQISLKSIKAIDSSSPTKLRIITEGGKSHAMNATMFDLDEYPRCIRLLRDVIAHGGAQNSESTVRHSENGA